MGNDALRVSVVYMRRGSLVRARVGARGRMKVKLLHMQRETVTESECKIDKERDTDVCVVRVQLMSEVYIHLGWSH